ncbi:MAG: TonB family protein [Pseudomonadota bacterium]|nr:TonB family protein [Pseudomonadota bacterium]
MSTVAHLVSAFPMPYRATTLGPIIFGVFVSVVVHLALLSLNYFAVFQQPKQLPFASSPSAVLVMETVVSGDASPHDNDKIHSDSVVPASPVLQPRSTTVLNDTDTKTPERAQTIEHSSPRVDSTESPERKQAHFVHNDSQVDDGPVSAATVYRQLKAPSNVPVATRSDADQEKAVTHGSAHLTTDSTRILHDDAAASTTHVESKPLNESPHKADFTVKAQTTRIKHAVKNSDGLVDTYQYVTKASSEKPQHPWVPVAPGHQVSGAHSPDSQQSNPGAMQSNSDGTEGEAKAAAPDQSAVKVSALDNPAPSQTATNGPRDGNAERDFIPRPAAGNAKPIYPLLARKRGVEGLVTLNVQIKQNGGVGQVILQHSSGSNLLDDEAIRAVQGWRFAPLTGSTSSTVVWTIVPVRFRLDASG